MVRRALKWTWMWAALYAIGGSLCLIAIADAVLGQAFRLSLPGLSLAAFTGCGLLALLTQGQSIREGVVAASMIALAELLFGAHGAIAHIEVFGAEVSGSHPVSTAMVCIFGAVLGGRLGAHLAARAQPLLERLGRVALAGLILLGACLVHGFFIAMVAELAPGLSTAVWLLVVVCTPSLAAAALQYTQRRPAESALALAIAAMVVVVNAAFLVEGYGLGLMCLSCLVMIFFGAAAYALALPGLMTVQASRSWAQVDAEVPQAIALPAADSAGGGC